METDCFASIYIIFSISTCSDNGHLCQAFNINTRTMGEKIFLMTKWNIGRHCLKKEWGKQSTSEVTLGPLIPIPSSNHTLKKVHHKTYCDNPLTLKEIARSCIASTRTLSCKLVSTLEANTLCRLCWIAGSINIWSICMFTSQAD